MLIHFTLESGADIHLNIDKTIPFALQSTDEGLRIKHPTHNNGGWPLDEGYSYEEVMNTLIKALNGEGNTLY